MLFEYLEHVYYTSSFDSFPADKTVQIILHLSPHFQNVYHTDTLSLTYFIGTEAIYYGDDHSFYNCSRSDFIYIAQENGYEVMAVPKLLNLNSSSLMFFYKSLLKRNISFIPINDCYLFARRNATTYNSVRIRDLYNWF